MIYFRKITYDNVDAVTALEVNEEQKTFVATNTASLVDAYVAIANGYIALPFGIYDEETLIGFIMFGYGSLEDDDEPEIANDNYCLWRLMIDKKYQNKGYGKAVMQEIIQYLHTNPCGEAECCWTSYDAENSVAKVLYENAGFIENGEMCGNEVVAVLKL